MKKVLKSNDRWSIFYNCSHFATGVWNSTTMTKKFTGGTPSEVVPQIKTMSGYVVNKLYPVTGSVAHN